MAIAASIRPLGICDDVEVLGHPQVPVRLQRHPADHDLVDRVTVEEWLPQEHTRR